MSNSRQLQIRCVRPDGDLGAPVKYPVGCVHRFVDSTRVLIFHPDDKNPSWRPEYDSDDDKANFQYLTAYAEQSCSRGLHVEYVAVEASLPQNDSHQLRPAA